MWSCVRERENNDCGTLHLFCFPQATWVRGEHCFSIKPKKHWDCKYFFLLVVPILLHFSTRLRQSSEREVGHDLFHCPMSKPLHFSKIWTRSPPDVLTSGHSKKENKVFPALFLWNHIFFFLHLSPLNREQSLAKETPPHTSTQHSLWPLQIRDSLSS